MLLMNTHLLLPEGNLYRTIMLAALGVSLFFWVRRARDDRRLLIVFLGAIMGGFTGAKIVYFLSEGWLHFGEPDVWLHLAAGKTIIGALLGGYLGIEIAKLSVEYRAPTGDWFAFIVPLGIAAGRIGCITNGCCLGIPLGGDPADTASLTYWPAAAVEMSFNLMMFALLLPMRKVPMLQGQLFHIYLFAYGIFRFCHEFLRLTPKPFLGLSGYQITALVLIGFAVVRFRQRERTSPSNRQHAAA